MWRWLKYRFELARLRRAEVRLAKTYEALLKGSEKKQRKSQNDIQELESEEFFEFRMVDDDIGLLQTTYLLTSARELFIDTEIDYAKDWEDSDTGNRYLKLAVLQRLNQAIRKERFERRQAWLVFLPALTGLTGLIGTIIGLVSLFSKKGG